MRLSLQNQPDQGCPGLPGAQYRCGEAKLHGQAYCTEHTKEYQRNRNRERKLRGEEWQTRPYHKDPSDQTTKYSTSDPDKCPVCQYVKPGKIVAITNLPGLTPLCTQCAKILSTLRTHFSMANIIALTDYLALPNNRAILLEASAGQKAFDEEHKRRIAEKQRMERWDSYRDAEKMYSAELKFELEMDMDSGKYAYDPTTQRIVLANPRSLTYEQLSELRKSRTAAEWLDLPEDVRNYHSNKFQLSIAERNLSNSVYPSVEDTEQAQKEAAEYTKLVAEYESQNLS